MDAKFLLNEALIILKICKKTKKNEILIFFFVVFECLCFVDGPAQYLFYKYWASCKLASWAQSSGWCFAQNISQINISTFNPPGVAAVSTGLWLRSSADEIGSKITIWNWMEEGIPFKNLKKKNWKNSFV